MVEAVEDPARRSLRPRPPSMRCRNPPRRFDSAAADLMPSLFGQKSREDEAPAICFSVRDISGGADEIAELKIADGEARDCKLAQRNLPHRSFAVIGKPVVVRPHGEGA